jgi:hypothetical protein
MPKLVVKSLKLIIKIILKGRYIGNVWRALNYYKDLLVVKCYVIGVLNHLNVSSSFKVHFD